MGRDDKTPHQFYTLTKDGFVIKKTTSLCFTKDGIINPAGLRYISDNPDVNTIVLFGDGSQDALHHICEFGSNPVLSLPKIRRVGIGRTPAYDLRVLSSDGSASKPHYVFSEDAKTQWLCAKVAAPHMQIYLSDFTSQSETQAQLDQKRAETVCYVAHKLWSLLLVAEDRLCFPAVVIDRMTRWTYRLTPETIDIDLLRKETGLSTLSYNSTTDLLSVTVGGEEFVIKLSVLQEVYGSLILPFFNTILGRRLRISVAITGNGGHVSEPTDMSYGELGRIVEGMKIYTKEQRISVTDPMLPQDLLAFAKKVKIDDESCFWVDSGETLETTIEKHISKLLSGNLHNDNVGAGDSGSLDEDPEGQSVING